MKLYIKGMSTNKRRIEDLLFTAGDTLVEHLMKLIQCPNAQARNHWTTEIYACLHDVPKLKGSNKYPSAKLIYNQLSSRNDILDHYSHYVKEIESDEYFKDVPPHVCLEYIDQYLLWISDMLSRYGEVSSAQIREKLKDIHIL